MARRKAAAMAEEEQERGKEGAKEEEEEGAEEGEEEEPANVKPIGEVIRRTGRGRSEKKYYAAFELDGARYNLEDSVLVTPEEKTQKPYVAIIKEIKESKDETIAVVGQWFYRPEEAEKKGGGSWVPEDTRVLFYSFHRDEVPAESVMHKCVVHFIPSKKKSPARTDHPGFIVRKVYDTVEKKLWNLTDKDYEDAKQKEIDLLVKKTEVNLGGFKDEDEKDKPTRSNDNMKSEVPAQNVMAARKKRKTMQYPPPIKVTREDIPVEDTKAEASTPASTKDTVTPGMDKEVYGILRQYNALTGNRTRDIWLEKLMHSIKSYYQPKELEINKQDAAAPEQKQEGTASDQKQEAAFSPEEALQATSALEKAAYDSIQDLKKYNIKMRSLQFNLKNVLARRLLAKELEPLTVVNMTPNELKEGITSAEKTAKEPQQPETIQMADARCSVCGEPQVGVKDIINAPHGDRYQLECLKCGHSWYSSRDAISSLTIETMKPSPTVGTAPWATSKFEEIQKKKETIGREHTETKDKDKQDNEIEKDNEPEKMDVDQEQDKKDVPTETVKMEVDTKSQDSTAGNEQLTT